MVVAVYVGEELTWKPAPASVKQNVAGLRMLFDWLVVGQVLPFNPANSVRGPKHVVKNGKTPVLSAEEARGFLDGIDLSTLVDLRDRALIGVLVFSLARITAAVTPIGPFRTMWPVTRKLPPNVIVRSIRSGAGESHVPVHACLHIQGSYERKTPLDLDLRFCR